MRSKVAIVICWEKGTDDMLSACLKSIQRFTQEVDYEVILACKDAGTYPNFTDTVLSKKIKDVYPVIEGDQPAHVHARMLDQVIPSQIDAEFVVTMDSDCFPIADGWLSGLIKKIEDGAKIVGILNPNEPPSPDLPKNTIEYRVMSQLCWSRTHVACQVMRTSDFMVLRQKGAKYDAGDDTGLDILNVAVKLGWKIDGYKVTRCPAPHGNLLDPEFNRYVCLVFGDKVYHHGGFTRKRLMNDDKVFNTSFSWCEKLILWGHGADFLLDPEFSYCFKFDREKEVTKEKMDRLFGMRGDSVMKG